MTADEILDEMEETFKFTLDGQFGTVIDLKNRTGLNLVSGYRELLAMHRYGGDSDDNWCQECGEFRYTFPCPTRQIINKALGVEE